MGDVSRVQVLITAAGDSRKLFLSAGFGCPKSLVKWEGREVLLHAVDSYGINLGQTTIAVNAEEDAEWGVGNVVEREFPECQVVRVSGAAKGALATALIALGEPSTAPLLVAAGDSRIAGGVTRFVADFVERGLDAATIAFGSSDARWSYLATDREGVVRQVAEKYVIGPYATTGVFYFSSSQVFYDAATWVLVNKASYKGQFYVSTTLNYLISTGCRVGFSLIDNEEYQSWSLPVDFAQGVS